MRYDVNKTSSPYARRVVYSSRGMVCASEPHAASAGLAMLARGGNAIDAAVATAACLTVTEPTSNGLGSDAFMIAWVDGKLYGLNGSGYSPESLTLDAVQHNMPKYGWSAVTIPGAPAAWAEISSSLGTLPFATLLQPAIDYAQNGFPVAPVVAANWANGARAYSQMDFTGRDEWFKTFTIDGRTPAAGEMFTLPNHAETLRELARTHSRSFYSGALADEICKASAAAHGFIRKDDLIGYSPEWTEPLSVNYRGYDIWELPPNGQGLVALMALKLLSKFDIPEKLRNIDIHRQIECMRLAFSEGLAHITDARHMNTTPQELLSDKNIDALFARITDTAVDLPRRHAQPGGTVYFCTADAHGNMVSMIQSNYAGFGSGIVVPGTGISLNNRGSGFSMDANHPNALAPRKKPYHTIIPGFITRDNAAVGPFGVMGGFMQPQGHLQVVSNMIDAHLNPQQALDAPRWQWIRGNEIQVERFFPEETVKDLCARGHNITVNDSSNTFGRGQIIQNIGGRLIGATEPRCDGHIALL